MKKRLHISSILLFIFVSSIVLPVEAQRIFSLDDCIQTGLERNFSIRIIRNEQTGKYFFAYGDKAGAVTSKYPVVKLDHPVISEVISEGRGEQFFLLHNIGDNPQFTTMEVL